MFGVRASVAPYGVESSRPWSSHKKTTIFGFAANTGETAAARIAAARRDCTRIIIQTPWAYLRLLSWIQDLLLALSALAAPERRDVLLVPLCPLGFEFLHLVG